MWKDITDVPESIVNRLKHYFLTYKNIPGTGTPTCEITNVYGKEEAFEVIRKSRLDYQNKFLK
jgi:inorganic pyrophosphatase